MEEADEDMGEDGVVPSGETILDEFGVAVEIKSNLGSISKSCRAASWKSIPYWAK